MKLKVLEIEEMKQINGGENLWDKWMKKVEDAGQYVGGFIDGLFTGDCPPKC